MIKLSVKAATPTEAFGLLTLRAVARADAARPVATIDPHISRRRGPTPRVGPLRRGRRVLLMALAICLTPAGWSYVTTMGQPSNSSFPIRSFEWLRDHGAAPVANKIENVYYSLTAPAKGGAALKALPAVAGAVVPPRRTPAGAVSPRSTSAGGLGATAVPAPAGAGVTAPAAARAAPQRIHGLIHPLLRDEGRWLASAAWPRSGSPVRVATFRSDPAYPRMVAGVAWIDTRRARIVLYPGRKEPSVPVPRGQMMVPRHLRRALLATFNSAFKLKDSRGGVAIAGRTYAPLVRGVATLVGYRDGHVNIRSWSAGPTAGPGVAFARQSLPLIVEHRRPNPNLADGPAWGATLGNAVRVWRSGVGIDHHGSLIFAAANNQTVGSLASILVRAGAVRAMELDINSYWVSFITYRQPFARDPVNLLPDMNRPAQRYLTPEDRDFFAVYQRGRAR